jgi:hypothetical protein
MNMNELENALLVAVGRLNRDDWAERNIVGWGQEITRVEPGLAATPHAKIVDTIVILGSNNLIGIQKYPYRASNPVPFDLARSNDDAYMREFFYTGSFQLRLMLPGRVTFDNLERTAVPVVRKRKIGFD